LTKRLNCFGRHGWLFAFGHAIVGAAVRSGHQALCVLGRKPEKDRVMAKRKGKNQSVPAKDAKYADRNNTKKAMAKKKV
jgi:hypothetical protein